MFLIKQLFHSHLLDMRLVIANSALPWPRWLFTISYPKRAYTLFLWQKTSSSRIRPKIVVFINIYDIKLLYDNYFIVKEEFNKTKGQFKNH